MYSSESCTKIVRIYLKKESKRQVHVKINYSIIEETVITIKFYNKNRRAEIIVNHLYLSPSFTKSSTFCFVPI